MKALIQFVKATLVGGLAVVLPVGLTVLLLVKGVKAALAVLRPVAARLPQSVVRDDLVAAILLVGGCFVIGLLVRTRPAQLLGDWMVRHVFGRIPLFTFLRGVARQLTGDPGEQSFQPALAEIEDALVPAFIVETHDDGHLTVFVSSSPTPMAGAIYILPPERVHPVDVPLRKALGCISKWGTGASAMRAAMRPKGSGRE